MKGISLLGLVSACLAAAVCAAGGGGTGGVLLSNYSLEVQLGRYVGPPPVGIYFDYHGATEEPVFIDHPHVDGVFVRIGWADVEPTRGVYDFSPLDEAIGPWIDAGKGLIIGVSLAGQHNNNTPGWVYDTVEPIEYERKGIDVKVPTYWDPGFPGLVKPMLTAFGARYNGNSDINAVLVGVAHIGFLTAMPNSTGAKEFMKAGWTPEKYKKYALDLCALYSKQFPNTRLWMRCAGHLIGISRPEDYGFDNDPFFTDTRDEILEQAARGYGCTIGFNALEADPAAYLATGAPQFLARMSDGVIAGRYGLEASDDWPMWLPYDRRVQGGPPANRLDDYSDASMNAYFEACMKNAIGGHSGIPRSHITLMKLLETDLSASYPGYEEYQQDIHKITAWVRAQMKSNAAALYGK